MIAYLQPLIKFELYSYQINDAAHWEREQQQAVELDQEMQEGLEQVKQTNSSRRRTLRPSLGTIPEDSSEASTLPFLTPNPRTRTAYVSPVKRWSAPVDRFRTPTKVAGSPMSKFTLAATSEASQLETTNDRGDFRVPSPTNTEITTALPDADLDTHVHHQVPSPAATENTARHTATTENPYHTAVPLFDQPANLAPVEPEHESKRRISLDNARRSDRRSDMKVLKRVRNWIASTHTPHRRHSDVTQILEQFRGFNRRHTLDVDVGRNPDIFAQNLPEIKFQILQEQSSQMPDHNAIQEGKTLFDMNFGKPQRKMTKHDHFTRNQVDFSADINEDVVRMDLNPEFTADVDSTEPSTELSPKKYTPRMEIPWNDSKLFAGIKPISTTNDNTGMASLQKTTREDIIVSKIAVPDAMDTTSNNEEIAEPTLFEDAGEDLLNKTTDTRIDISEDSSNISEDSDGECVDENIADVFDGTVQKVENAIETVGKTPAETDQVTGIEENKDTTDDDSALALLHSFVRRAQHIKEGKQTTIQDSVPVLPLIAKKRLSGSMSSATSDTGSPMARVEADANTPSSRKPLGTRDANRSPSPNKKRRLGEADGAPLFKKSGRLAKPDLEDIEPSQPKKRRKKMESDTEDIFNPEMDMSQVLTQKSRGNARRSSRIATTRSSKAENVQSGFSTIPVRLPGSSGMLPDPGVPTVSTTGITNAVLQRKVEKDLATETRTNTRKNKGGAVPVPVALVVLAHQQQSAGDSTIELPVAKARPSSGKTVHWDAILARVQGEKEPTVVATTVTSPEVQEAVDGEYGKNEEDENLPSPPQMRHVGLSPSPPATSVAGQLDEHAAAAPGAAPAEPEKKQLPRRSTRSSTVSRLPRSGGPVAIVTPKKSSLPAPSRVTKLGRSATNAGVASSVAGRLGTPAPKRRGARR